MPLDLYHEVIDCRVWIASYPIYRWNSYRVVNICGRVRIDRDIILRKEIQVCIVTLDMAGI